MPAISTTTAHYASAARVAATLVPAHNTTSSTTTPVSDSTVAFYFDVALLCVLAAFFLAALPRAVVRFSHATEWGKGLILLGGRASGNHFRITAPRQQISSPINFDDRADDGSDNSHTLHEHNTTSTHKLYGGKTPLDEKQASRSLPRRIQSMSTLTYPVSTFLSKTVQPGTSIGQLLLQTLYTCAIILVTFYQSNPITDPERIGFIAISQIPVVFVFGMKNSIPGMLLGMSYEKLNWVHRFAGMTTFVLAHIHTLSYVYKWVTAGTLDSELRKPNITAALVSLIGLDISILFTLALVRQKAYNAFLMAHVFGIIVFPVAVCFHETSAIPYVALAYITYGFDQLYRLVKSRLTTARIRVLPELESTLITFPSIRTGWRSGQHVRIRMLSSEMGWLGWSEAHPFTVASKPGDELALVVKRSGGWTGKVYDVAMRAGYVQGSGNVEKGIAVTREVKIIVEGPYGGMGHMLPESYSGAMFVAGGSGITHALSIVTDLVHKAAKGGVRTKFVELVWIVQDQSSLIPLASQLNNLISMVSPIPGFFLKITIFYTRISPSSTSNILNPDPFKVLHTSVGVIAGRPPLNNMLGNMIGYISAVSDPKGIAVGVCGPLSLAEEVKKVVGSVDGPRRSTVGGLDLHEEVFGW